MTRLRLIVWAVLLTTIGLTFPPKLAAQSKSTTASLSGTVTDPSGARVAKATVKLTNPENGIARTDTTTQTGEFSFALACAGQLLARGQRPGIQDNQAKRDRPHRREIPLNIGITLDHRRNRADRSQREWAAASNPEREHQHRISSQAN